MTVKRIGFVGVRERQGDGQAENTGNVIHGNAARAMFAKGMELRPDMRPDAVREHVDCIGVVAATTIHVKGAPNYLDNQVKLANFLERVDLPTIPFGVGCHAQLDATVSDAKVDPRTVRYLKVLSDLSHSIAVRGPFTADLCASFGVNNVHVAGCQSVYYSTVLNDPGTYAHRDTFGRAFVTISNKPLESRILAFCIENGIDQIAQDDMFCEWVSRNVGNPDQYLKSEKAHAVPRYAQSALTDGLVSKKRYYEYLHKNFHKFRSAPEWVRYVQQHFDFGFGTRFHGNVAGLQAGIPVLWLVHDMRTRELSDLLGLPNMPLEDFESCGSLADIRERCDFTEFEAGFPARLRAFLSYFDKHGVSHLLDPHFKARCARWLEPTAAVAATA